MLDICNDLRFVLCLEHRSLIVVLKFSFKKLILHPNDKCSRFIEIKMISFKTLMTLKKNIIRLLNERKK